MTDEELLKKSPLSGELQGKVFSVPGTEVLTANVFKETKSSIPGLVFEYFDHGNTVEYHVWAGDGVFDTALVEKMHAVLLVQDAFRLLDFWHVDDVFRTFDDSEKGLSQESVGFVVAYNVTPPMSYELVVRCIIDIFRD